MYTERTVNFFYQYFDMKFIQIKLKNKKIVFRFTAASAYSGKAREELAV